MRLKKSELAAFMSNLSALISAGYAQIDALETLVKICDKSVKAVSIKLLDEVRNGRNLSDAFAEQPELCRYANVVRAGEKSGRLAELLQKLSERIQNSNKTLSQLKTAMYYPAFVLVMAICAAAYMLREVVPKFAEILADTTGGGLPALTVAVMGLSEMLSKHLFLLILITVIAILTIRWLIKKPLKMQFSAFVLKLPIIGELIRNSEISSFFNSVSFLLDAGLPASEAVKTAADAAENPYMKSKLGEVPRDMISEGKSLHEALSGVQFLTEIERQCVIISGKSGKTSEMLCDLSGRLTARNTQLLKRLTSLFQPMLIIIVGGIVGTIVVAMYMPVVELMKV